MLCNGKQRKKQNDCLQLEDGNMQFSQCFGRREIFCTGKKTDTNSGCSRSQKSFWFKARNKLQHIEASMEAFASPLFWIINCKEQLIAKLEHLAQEAHANRNTRLQNKPRNPGHAKHSASVISSALPNPSSPLLYIGRNLPGCMMFFHILSQNIAINNGTRPKYTKKPTGTRLNLRGCSLERANVPQLLPQKNCKIK